MKMNEKLELMRAVSLVADFWGVEPAQLVSFTATFERPEKKAEWNKIAEEVIAFSKMTLPERAEKMGIKLLTQS